MRVRVVSLALLTVAGCGGQIASIEDGVKELRARVDEVARTQTASRNRMEDVENRVLLLQDELETRKVAAARGVLAQAPAQPPPLPVVKVAPPAPEAVAEGRAPSGDGGFDYQEIDEQGRVTTSRGTPAARVREARADSKVAPAKPSAARPGDDPAPLAAYRGAREAYDQGRTQDAMKAFGAFVEAWPKHPYSDNAQYWVGECMYDLKDFAGAKREFLRVVSEHPDGNKVPDAMVKVGLCDRQLEQFDEARRMFDAVMLTYPDSPAASVAMRLAGELP